MDPQTPKSHAAEPKHAPSFRQDQEVVLRKYEDGRHWHVLDAILRVPHWTKRRAVQTRPPYGQWCYLITSVRPDGTTAKQWIYEWRLKPVDNPGWRKPRYRQARPSWIT